MAEAQTELYGRRFGLAATGQTVANGINITAPCVDCTITVGAETTNVIPITIQLKDANGNDINYVEVVEVLVTGAGLTAAADGGSTGLAIGTDGAILATPEAKKHFIVSSEADGDIDFTFTDTGTSAYYVSVRLPTGRIVTSAVVQMAP